MSNCPNCENPYSPGDEACQYCGYVFPFSTDILTPNTVLQGRYRIDDLTHSGGMGYVYQAKDIKLHDRLCIVKQVKEPVKSDADLKKLEAEAIEMAKLNHPNVAMIFDHFVEGQFYFLVVEYISGKTLSEIFAEHQWQLNEDDVIKWAISMCEVVSYLHRAGIVHRDISPQNIMLTDEGIIKFIDFGTLRELRLITTGGTAGMGKFGYAPPEQWRGKPEPRSDLFALGATIYYLLTGFLPLSNEYLAGQEPQYSEFNPTFPPIREKNPRITPELDAILQKALQLDIDHRYSSANELEQTLRKLIEVKAPVLSIDCERLEFIDIISGKQCTRTFSIMNAGTDRLTGDIRTTKPWLKVSPSVLDIEAGEQEISVIADTTGTSPGFYDTGNINIVTNGGEASIYSSLSTTSFTKHALTSGIAWASRLKWLLLFIIIVIAAVIIIPNTILKAAVLSVDSNHIDFTNVMPGDISDSRSFIINNTGGNILTGTIESNKDWLIVSPTELKVPYGEETISVLLDTKNLPYGFKGSGLIDIKTNGGDIQITVNLTMTNIIFEDDFGDSSSGWTTSSNKAGEAKYENGSYYLSTQGAGRLIAGTNITIGELSDFILEVDTKSQSSTTDASHGIIFRQQDLNRFDNFYYFHISSFNRQYKVEKVFKGTWSSLTEGTDSDAINKDLSINRLKVVCKGTQIEIYVNDISLATITDTSFLKGYTGLAVASGSGTASKAAVTFDNIAISFPNK